ncbi:ParA family protein [soil metagenome]
MIVAVGNQKGGVGKTTTALTLGHLLKQEGAEVALIDFDAPSSFRKAGNGLGLHYAEQIGLKAYAPDELPDSIDGHLFMDLPPDAGDAALNLAAGVADAFIVPTRLDRGDLMVTNAYANLLGEMGVPFKVLITMVHPNSKSVAAATRSFLSEHAPVFESFITSYEVYRDAAEGGSVAGLRTVAGRKATRDYVVLLHELRTWLNEI